jgi:hypothetical protein
MTLLCHGLRKYVSYLEISGNMKRYFGPLMWGPILVLGSIEPLSTSKASLRDEAFSHTYKVIISPFHNQCGIIPTISSSHIGF